MSRNGSGVYSLPVNSWNPAINGVSATAADWQNLANDIAAALTQSLSSDGQTPVTGNLPMTGNKLTGLGAGSATGDSLRWEQLFSQGTPQNLASATTTDIGAQNSVFLNITGTTTITSFGTNYNGPRYIRFDGALTLTHNATTLILPGAANITTAAGDSAIVLPSGSPANGWRVAGYQKADGSPLAIPNGFVTYEKLGSNVTPILTGRNKIINGKMEIAQRGTSFAAIASGAYSLDRWLFGNSSSAVITASQQADAPSGNEFQNSLRLAVTTADASIAAGDQVNIQQRIEGFNVRDLIGRTFTISFWVRSSKTGIHCVSIGNNVDRSYVTEYTINAANTWELKTITVSGGLITAGTWNWTTGLGLYVAFMLASGSTFQTTANAWQTGNFLATANQVNCLDTIGNIFAITGVQLEVGSVATPFEHRSFGTELALCQRYYYRFAPGGNAQIAVGQCASTTQLSALFSFPVDMRVAPTTLEQSGTAGHYEIYYGGSATLCSTVPTFQIASTRNAATVFTLGSALLAVGQAAIARIFGASGFVGWSAEL